LFPSATFCVFSNRALAICFSALASWKFYGTVYSSAPLIKFTPCALSNTISSWAQYKALNFVTFSLQTLFKSTKVIPVMLMGTLLKDTRYSMVEYFEAIAITIGVAMFSFGQKDADSEQVDPHVQFVGFLLLSTYVLADSFTAQYQNKIYTDYGKLNQYHMMFGVNVSSIIITAIAMLFSGEMAMVAEFLYMNPLSGWYNFLTAICSTTGQVAIYYTIKRFGPITFVIIMTTRQMFSMIISTFLFGHTINAMGVFGSLFVFAAVFHSIYRQNNSSSKSSKAESKSGKSKTQQEPNSSSPDESAKSLEMSQKINSVVSCNNDQESRHATETSKLIESK